MKKIYLLLLLVIMNAVSWAQAGTITGKVTSPDRAPLQGVTISVTTTTGKQQTTTDENGNYSITLSGHADALVFTYVGMEELVEKINGRSVINVQLSTAGG